MDKFLRFSVPVLVFAFALGAVVPATFAAGSPPAKVRDFTATISPTSSLTSATQSYTVTITNSGTSDLSEKIRTIATTIPGNWSIASIAATTGWTISTTSTSVKIKAGAGKELSPNESAAITFQGSSPASPVTSEWTTMASKGNNWEIDASNVFTLSGTQPSVTVSAPLIDQSISFGTLADKTYGDADFSVSATGGASGEPVTFSSLTSSVCTVTTDGTALHIVSAGTCTIAANQAGTTEYNAAPEVDQSFTINKADASISVTPYSVTYDGGTHAATGSATGIGSDGSLSGLDLSATAHTNAGEYTSDAWTFTDVSGNYNDAGGTVHDSITQATPTIHVTNSPAVDTGSAQTATVTGSVAGVVSNIMYDGSSTEPSAVGTYAVTADFVPTDATNYISLTNASAGNFVINAGPVDIIAVDAISDIHVTTGTALGSVGLPATVGVTYDDATTGTLAVSWDGGTPPYDGTTDGTYVFSGTLSLPLGGGVTNTGSLTAEVHVVVAPLPTYTLTYSAGSNGSLTGTSTQSVVQGNDGTAVTAVPDSGFRFSSWSDGSSANPRTDTNVTGDITVTANFTQLVFGGGAGGPPSFTPSLGQVLGVSTSTISTSTPPTTEEIIASSTPQVLGEVLGASTFMFTKDLRYRMRDSDVSELQKLLVSLGFSIPDAVTNYFGPQTFAAVKEFQKGNNLPATGFVGSLTRAALNAIGK